MQKVPHSFFSERSGLLKSSGSSATYIPSAESYKAILIRHLRAKDFRVQKVQHSFFSKRTWVLKSNGSSAMYIPSAESYEVILIRH